GRGERQGAGGPHVLDHGPGAYDSFRAPGFPRPRRELGRALETDDLVDRRPGGRHDRLMMHDPPPLSDLDIEGPPRWHRERAHAFLADLPRGPRVDEVVPSQKAQLIHAAVDRWGDTQANTHRSDRELEGIHARDARGYEAIVRRHALAEHP